MNVDPIPRNLVAVHDLLTETMTVANEANKRFVWGVAIFPRTGRFDAPVFGVVTCGGESTTLTYRLLQTLMELPVYVSGRVASTVRDGMAFGPRRTAPPPALLDQPVLHVMLTCCIGSTIDDLDRTMALESTVFAGRRETSKPLRQRRNPAALHCFTGLCGLPPFFPAPTTSAN